MTSNTKETVNQRLFGTAASPGILSDAGADHVVILMALYNGRADLDSQLESYRAQSHRNWSLIVSDDGSLDDGPDRIRDFAARTDRDVTLLRGPGQGFARNFLELLVAAGPHVPFAALSDQDDVWLPEKLGRALRQLANVPDGQPALYAGRTVICDQDLKPLRRSPEFALPPSFRNALVQSIGGGNTMVLNRAALDLAQETARYAEGIVAHDWWLYQIVSGAGGRVIYDPEPLVLYRQHDRNLIGANDTMRASLHRLAQVMRGRFRDWNTANSTALDAAAHWLTPEARDTLARFRDLRSHPVRRRLAALRDIGLYRQTARGNIALKLAALFNRI